MGGSGRRFGHAIPKQFTDIKGKPYFAYIFEDFQKVTIISWGIVWSAKKNKYPKYIIG